MTIFERIVADGGTGWSLGLRFEEGHRVRESLIGWLRAAYLVGYRYILHEALNPVREQIGTPNVTLIRGFSVSVPAASSQDRLLALVEEPAEIRSLMVRMGARAGHG